jgi:hypothetical protein
MTKAYSLDLRRRVVRFVDSGHSSSPIPLGAHGRMADRHGLRSSWIAAGLEERFGRRRSSPDKILIQPNFAQHWPGLITCRSRRRS